MNKPVNQKQQISNDNIESLDLTDNTDVNLFVKEENNKNSDSVDLTI